MSAVSVFACGALCQERLAGLVVHGYIIGGLGALGIEHGRLDTTETCVADVIV